MESMTGIIIAYMVIAGGAFWFFGRKQRQRAKEIQAQRDAMKIGDKVVTIGGLHGEIYNIDTVNHTVDLDCEGVILTFERAAIHHVVTESAATNNEVYTDEVATEEE